MIGSGPLLPGAVPFSASVAQASGKDLAVEGKGPLDEILCLYTPGTAGEPKGIPLNQLDGLLRSNGVLMHFPSGPREKTLNMI
jgi:long-subunit acyl-CoA synthetase (AMP-forming)